MSDHQHGEDCGCEHEEDVILLTDENGVEHEMVIVYSFAMQDKEYAVLLDRNDPEVDGVILRMEEEGDEVLLIPIEDDEEWDRAVAVYNQIVEEESRV